MRRRAMPSARSAAISPSRSEVTTKMTWVAASADALEGRGCYAPAEGFAPGRHYAAVSVQDPNNPAANPRQVVGWEFDVR